MEVSLNNCNSIDSGTIVIDKNHLNIKYAINGTGKSTIARAIKLLVDGTSGDSNELESLRSFKHMGSKNFAPSLSFSEELRSVKIFDEKYISEFLFLENELLKGSYDILIRDDAHEKGMQVIDSLITEMGKTLAEDKEIADLINDFSEISNSFGKQTKKGLHGSSPLAKAFKDGNKIENVPEGLEDFSEYIKSNVNYKWIKWQQDGSDFIDMSDNCPYCITSIPEKKDKIKAVAKAYEPKNIENLNKIISTFQRLNEYFSEETNDAIGSFVRNVSGPTNDQVEYLIEVKDQIDRLAAKFISIQRLGFESLKDVDKVIEGLKDRLIDVNLFIHLKSDKTKSKVAIANAAMNTLIEKAGQLQGSINKQKIHIEKLIEENSKKINGFLRAAGYKYSVSIDNEGGDGQPRLKLKHIEKPDEIKNARLHLSFGERNAFALVLFMLDAIKENPDLIILDDPISSFDKSKKYAIVDMLFRKETALKGKTVLLLTHDFEPIVDMVYHHVDRFEKISAYFIENMNGSLRELKIRKDDIQTFMEIGDSNIRSSINEISKLIYLRRLCEVTNNKGLMYQLISSLVHKREIPCLHEVVIGDNGATFTPRQMTHEEIDSASNQIREKVPGFSYDELLSIIKNDGAMKSLYENSLSNYEKLHIYRLILTDNENYEDVDSDVIRKFINESYHIENDYIYQLNPCTYQTVPQYVIEECTRILKTPVVREPAQMGI